MSYNHHIYHWIEKIEDNITSFKSRKRITNKQRVEFITHQYHLVMLIYRALNNQVIFVGANPIADTSRKDSTLTE